jgi:hypothetical protein
VRQNCGLKCYHHISKRWVYAALQLVLVYLLVYGEPPIFVSIYVDDIFYFSVNDSVERVFEEKLSTIGNVDFMGQVSLFSGTEFSWVIHEDGHVTVSLTQQSFIETLIDSLGIYSTHTAHFTTPFRSGHVIDSIVREDMPSSACDELRLVGFHPFMLRCYFTRYATIYSTLCITQLMSYLTLCYAHVPHTYDRYRTACVVYLISLCSTT